MPYYSHNLGISEPLYPWWGITSQRGAAMAAMLLLLAASCTESLEFEFRTTLPPLTRFEVQSEILHYPATAMCDRRQRLALP